MILVQEPGALDYTVPGLPLRGSDAVVRDYRRATAAIADQLQNVTLVRPLLRADDYLGDGLHPDRSGNRRVTLAIQATTTWRDVRQHRLNHLGLVARPVDRARGSTACSARLDP